jgi:hypothetical protein
MASTRAARQTANVFRIFGIVLLVADVFFVVFHAVLFFRSIANHWSDLMLDLNVAALHFVGNTVAVMDLIGGITSFMQNSKECTVKQVESTNCFLLSMFTMYADAVAIARASLAASDGVAGFDNAYRALVILLFCDSFVSMVWSVSVYVWSSEQKRLSCEKEEDTPIEADDAVRESITSAARRLISAQTPTSSEIAMVGIKL